MFRSLIPLTRQIEDPFAAFQRDMGRLIDNSFRGLGPATNGASLLAPSLDVKETERVIEVAAELPGVDQKEVNVTYVDGVLTIKGEKKAEKEETKSGYRVSERSYGSFLRSLAIDDVDADKIEANFTNGVLKVTLPKMPATQSKTKTIAIKSAK